jgi:hypothetical protein
LRALVIREPKIDTGITEFGGFGLRGSKFGKKCTISLERYACQIAQDVTAFQQNLERRGMLAK